MVLRDSVWRWWPSPFPLFPLVHRLPLQGAYRTLVDRGVRTQPLEWAKKLSAVPMELKPRGAPSQSFPTWASTARQSKLSLSRGSHLLESAKEHGQSCAKDQPY
jgi:hypothetical protein